MQRTPLTLLFLLAVSGHAMADPDSPLALTGQAGAQAALSPTAADQALSQQYLSTGQDCLRQGHANAALQALLDAVRLAPDADNTKALGTAYYQLGNLPKAAWAYRQSLQWRPDGRVQSMLEQLEARGTDRACQDTAAPAAAGAPSAVTASARPSAAPAPTVAAPTAVVPPSNPASASPVPEPPSKPGEAGRNPSPVPRGNEAPK
jgi:tetratricopeptide (TPR) repeat protein